MGLWRKQTVQAQEAEQFDIRGIVNEFKSNICAYQHWKEGMDIEVSHVKRREIPLFVFPGGVLLVLLEQHTRTVVLFQLVTSQLVR